MTDKVVFLTGAAGGIGSATARKLADRGFTLYLVDLKNKQKELQQLASSLPGMHYTDAIDLRDRSSIAKAVKRCIAKTGHIDVLVNNAGLMHPSPLARAKEAEIDDQLQTNLYGAIHLTNLVLPHLLQSRGSVVFVSSLAGIVPAPLHSVYGATKAALRSLSMSLHFELREAGVSVTCVLPGTVAGAMTNDMAKRSSSPMAYVHPPIDVQSVAEAVVRAVYSKQLEIYVPYGQGFWSRIGVLFPGLLHAVFPVMAKKGSRNYEKWTKSGVFGEMEHSK